MNSLTRIMSFDKSKTVNQENCDCIECTNVEVENQIVEYPHLTDEEIEKACELSIEAGADYVKTGTGFSNDPTTVHHVQIMYKAIGGRAKLKVAGGVRSQDTLMKM